jgi:hypothetical protein
MKDKESDLYGYAHHNYTLDSIIKECYLIRYLLGLLSLSHSYQAIDMVNFLEFLITSQSQIVIDLQVKEQYLRRDFL